MTSKVYSKAFIEKNRESWGEYYRNTPSSPLKWRERPETDAEVIARLKKEAEEAEQELLEQEEYRRAEVRDRLNTEDLQNCCGICEIGGFRGHTKKQIAESLEELEHFQRKGGEDGHNDTLALFLATTTPDQRAAIAALKACGFEHLPSASRARNPSGRKNRHNSTITLWYKYLGRRGISRKT